MQFYRNMIFPMVGARSDSVADCQSLTKLIFTSVDVKCRDGQLFLDQTQDVTLPSGREGTLEGVGYRLETNRVCQRGAFLHKMYSIPSSPCTFRFISYFSYAETTVVDECITVFNSVRQGRYVQPFGEAS